MNIHQNARLTPKGRALLVRRILAGVSQNEPPAVGSPAIGPRGKPDCVTAPRGPVTARAAPPRPSSTASSPCADNVARVAASPATVSRLLGRARLNRLPDLEPAPAVRRYEHPAPGELLHLDIKKLGRFRRTGRRLGNRHRFTPPYTPRTNGKAERFIQTALQKWAYARSYLSSPQRAAHLRPWLHDYNWHRPHASLG